VATQIVDQTFSVHRFSVEEVMALFDAGFLDDECRYELVDGVLIEMMGPASPRHAAVVEWLTRHFVIAAGEKFSVRIQDYLLTADRGFRSPDLIVFEPGLRDRLPDTASLVVEVAHTSRSRDMGKASVYAAGGVSEYWIVDVDRDEVLVHREPSENGYASVERFKPGDTIVPLVELVPVDVAALLAR
jgi:Uma2 family endonuclease